MNSSPYFLKRTVRNCAVRKERGQSVASASSRDAQVDTMSEGIRTDMQDLTNAQFPSSRNPIRCWNEFSAGWKKVRRGFWNRRSMISELEFAFAMTHAPVVDTSIRKFRKTLRRFGALRDIQVHLPRSASENAEWARQFSSSGASRLPVRSVRTN